MLSHRQRHSALLGRFAKQLLWWRWHLRAISQKVSRTGVNCRTSEFWHICWNKTKTRNQIPQRESTVLPCTAAPKNLWGWTKVSIAPFCHWACQVLSWKKKIQLFVDQNVFVLGGHFCGKAHTNFELYQIYSFDQWNKIRIWVLLTHCEQDRRGNWGSAESRAASSS